MTPEGRILRAVTRHLAGIEVKCIRLALQSSVLRGWPDLCVLIPGGVPLFLELKRPGGRTSKAQDRRHEELRNAGYTVAVCDSIDAAVAVIAQAMDARALSA